MSTRATTEIEVEHLMNRIRSGLAEPVTAGATVVADEGSAGDVSVELDELVSALQFSAPSASPVDPVHFSFSMPATKAGEMLLRAEGRHRYHVREFLSYDGVEFISNVYRALLWREVDEDGLGCYLAMLRGGASKVEVLGRIARSFEAKRQRTRIRGLWFRYFFDSASRWPLLGRVIAIVVAVWNLPATERRIRCLSAKLAGQLQEIEQEAACARNEIYRAFDVLARSHNRLADLALTLADRKRVDSLYTALSRVVTVVKGLELKSAEKLSRGCFEASTNQLRREMDRKAEQTSITELQLQVQSLSATKADQRVFRTLRAEMDEFARKDDLEGVASAVSQINDAVAAVNREKAHKRELYALRSDVESEIRTSFDRINVTIRDLGRIKADQSSLTSLREEAAAALSEAMQTSIQPLSDCLNVLAGKLEVLEAKASDRSGADAIRAETLIKVAEVRAQLSETLERALTPINLRAENFRRELIDQDRRVGLLLEAARRRFGKPISPEQVDVLLSEEEHRLDAMYARFEDQFRGTRADIRQRQAIYLPYVRDSNAGTSNWPVIDVGCGRGEWLELLRDEGFVGKGVDRNRVFLDECRELNLEVYEQDALAFLREQKQNSVGAITSFHMIEHLELRTLVAFLDEALRVLRPGGVVIFETPNPQNLLVGSCNFYVDPTHQRPLPPDLSRYLLEARGYVRVEARDLHPHAREHWISEGPEGVRDALNRILHSAQDYAVIGWKA